MYIPSIPTQYTCHALFRTMAGGRGALPQRDPSPDLPMTALTPIMGPKRQ